MIAFRVASIPMKTYWSPRSDEVSRLDPFLLLADVRPQLVEFESVNLDELHKTVVQLGASIADADAKAHDRVTMNASQALSSAD